MATVEKKRTKTNESEGVILEIPIAEFPDCDYAAREVKCYLDSQQANACKGILRALEDRGEKLRSGKTVRDSQDVFRWMLEQVAAQQK